MYMLTRTIEDVRLCGILVITVQCILRKRFTCSYKIIDINIYLELLSSKTTTFGKDFTSI